MVANVLRLTCNRGVGFLRYWTVSNLPLFLVSAPMLTVLLLSSKWVWNGSGYYFLAKLNNKSQRDCRFNYAMLRRLAMPQIVLALLALTTYHVQIVTRLSSGYPIWYWWLASMIMSDGNIECWGEKWNVARWSTRWMIVYALIQGGLFASFLPPA